MFFSIILNTQFCFDFQYALLVELGLVKKACFYHLCFIATNEYVPECFFFFITNQTWNKFRAFAKKYLLIIFFPEEGVSGLQD